MARASKIGSLYAELSVKDKMTVGIKRAEKSLIAFGSKVASIGAGMAAALPAAAFAGVVASMKSALDAGGKLSDMMARTGASGEGLFVMQRAFENAGIAGDKVPGVLNKMQKALAGVNEQGERVQSRVFADLGLSISELQNMDAAQAFRTISESISKIPDPAKRAALAMEIFGRSGGELLVVMNDGKAFSGAAQQIGGLGKTLADNAEKFDKISDSLQTFGIKAQQIGAEVAVELLPALEQMADYINELDLGEGTRDAIEFAKAIGNMADNAARLSKELPGIKQARGLLGLAESGIGYAASFNPEQGTAMPTPNAWVGGDPLSNYNDGVMVDGLKNFTDTIPEILKRQADIVAGLRLEDAGIPGIAGIIEAIAASTAIPEDPEEKKPEARSSSWDSVSADVNSMQSRGLGMGSIYVPKEIKDQVSLLEQIKNILKDRANTDGLFA